MFTRNSLRKAGRRSLVATSALLLTMTSHGVHAGLDEGMAAHRRGDYLTAQKEFRPLAEKGNAVAQYTLASMYDEGLGVPQDDTQAFQWYRKAADQGNANAQFHVGLAYANGLGVKTDPSQALSWYRKAADQGHTDALYNLGMAYADGFGTTKNEAQAIQWLRKAAAKGSVEARSALARRGVK